MGMDLIIVAAKNKERIEKDDWSDWYEYEELEDNCEMWDEDGTIIFPEDTPVQMWYARKFYALVDAIPELKETFNAPYMIRLKKDTLKQMIEFYAFHEDYFEGFNGLPRLCMLYRDYNKLQAKGINLYFINSY